MWKTAPSFVDWIHTTMGVGLGMIVGGGHQKKLLQVEETQGRWQRSLNSRLWSLYLIGLSLWFKKINLMTACSIYRRGEKWKRWFCRKIQWDRGALSYPVQNFLKVSHFTYSLLFFFKYCFNLNSFPSTSKENSIQIDSQKPCVSGTPP